MTATMWIDVETEQYMSRSDLADRRRLARRLYETNAHLFEDEMDALSALGALPVAEYQRLEDRRRPLSC